MYLAKTSCECMMKLILKLNSLRLLGLAEFLKGSNERLQ